MKLLDIVNNCLKEGRFIVFGKIIINVEELNSRRYGIEVLDEDVYDTTCIFNLYCDEEGTVGFIEHSFNAITLANHQSVRALTNIIGLKITNISEYMEVK